VYQRVTWNTLHDEQTDACVAFIANVIEPQATYRKAIAISKALAALGAA
jgi:hypothetical protein